MDRTAGCLSIFYRPSPFVLWSSPLRTRPDTCPPGLGPRGTANRGLLVRIAEQPVGQDPGDLSPGSGGIWSECVVGVARHDLGRVGGLNEVKGPVGGAYVGEGGGGGRVHEPFTGHDHHLRHLGAGYVLVRAERAVV